MSESTNPRQYGFSVGPAMLGWSLRENSSIERNGYIYMKDASPGDAQGPPLIKPLWEFALTTKHRLTEVTQNDLHCEFYGMDDPRGTNVFGEDWTGDTIRVPEGQIFFARLVTNRSTVYII
jgi:hypothetical protein